MKRADISKILLPAVAKVAPDAQVAPEISYPEPQFGDFSCNIAFSLAKSLKKAPQQIATDIAAAIDHPLVAKAEAVAGFVNLTMAQDVWLKELAAVTPDYAHSKAGKGKKVQVEFISANPTGPTTFGNARGGYLGDVLARVLRASGYDTTSEYYFNDGGTQIRKLVESVKVAAGLAEDHDEVQYKGEYVDELAKQYKDRLTVVNQDEAEKLLTQAIFERYIKPAVASMNISFDVWFNEREVTTTGAIAAVIDKLKAKDLIYDKDGATWLATTKYDPSREDRVLIKSSGDSTYLAGDLAYHWNIFAERHFDRSIKVWGPDHVGQFPSLKLTMQQLLPDSDLQLMMFQWVRLVQGGKEVKVSKRAGTIITIEEVVEQIGSDVARFFFLMRAAESHIDFDLDLAKDRSNKNPLFYLLYSYARAQSIFKQAGERDLQPAESIDSLTAHEVAVARHISRLPELVTDIADDFNVHKLAFYGIELAQAFHDWYEQEKIIDLEPEIAAQKLYFVQRYTVFFELYAKLIGITPQIEMR